MLPPLHYILIPAVTAFLAALLAIFLTPASSTTFGSGKNVRKSA